MINVREAAWEAIAAYDWRVKRGLAPMGKIDSMERLRTALKEETPPDPRAHECPARQWKSCCPYPSVCRDKEACVDGVPE